jgi:predicted cobalt transporter CbtA
MKAYLGRGALAGIAGGFAAALFQWLVTENQIRKALAIEAAREVAAHDEMFSRTTQVIWGMLAACLYGTFLGLIFAILCAAIWRYLPARTMFTRAIHTGTVVFISWTLIPALKYPANPPAVGNPDTIGIRTTAYLLLIAVSVALSLLCWALWRELSSRGLDGAKRFAYVVTVYVAAIAAIYLIFPPSPDTVDAPATLIWHFRLDSLAGNALLWLVLAMTFGWLGDRAVAKTGPHIIGEH